MQSFYIHYSEKEVEVVRIFLFIEGMKMPINISYIIIIQTRVGSILFYFF